MAVGLQIWNAEGGLVFDTTSLAGRQAGTLVLTAPAQGTFAMSGRQPGNEAWISVQFYNVPFLNMQNAQVILINQDTISYDIRELPAGTSVHVHYGWK